MVREKKCAQHIGADTVNFQFGDRRVNRRGNKIIKSMQTSSGKSLPEAFCTEADLKGAYRFFDNDLVLPEKILSPHIEETIERCKFQKTVSVIQDSSDLDFDYMNSLEGFGPLHEHVNKGFRLHPLLAVNEKGTPLGILGSYNYTRSSLQNIKKHRNDLPIEEKESMRWLWGYREACKLAKIAPDVLVVSVSDSEGDIYECLREAQDIDGTHKAAILVRAQHNRSLASREDETTDKLEKKLIRSSVIYEAKLSLTPHGKKNRVAHVVVRSSKVLIKAPATSKKKNLPSIEMNAILVTEVDPPKGEQVHWLLLTTLPINSIEEIKKIILLYSRRWTIELFFKTLKSGCGIDSHRLQECSRIENYIALAMIIAWRVMLATYLPREYPDAVCTVLLTDLEWKLAYLRVYDKTMVLPKKAITLKEAITLIAILGGYQKRKEPPGIQTIWKGMNRLMDMVYGHELTKRLRLS